MKLVSFVLTSMGVKLLSKNKLKRITFFKNYFSYPSQFNFQVSFLMKKKTQKTKRNNKTKKTKQLNENYQSQLMLEGE